VQFLEAGPSLVDRTMWPSLKNVCPPLTTASKHLHKMYHCLAALILRKKFPNPTLMQINVSSENA